MSPPAGGVGGMSPPAGGVGDTRGGGGGGGGGSCDPDATNKILFPLSKEAPLNLALIGPRFWRRRSLSIVDDMMDNEGRTPDHEYPISSPKLTYEPLAQVS